MPVTFWGGIFETISHNKAHEAELASAAMVQDIYTAIFAHENLKYRLVTFTEGLSQEAFTAEQVYHTDNSELGQWIRGVGLAKFSKFRAFTRLIEHHKMFHYAAANVVSLTKAGKMKEANTMMAAQFEDFSDAIISDLLTLRETVEATRQA